MKNIPRALVTRLALAVVIACHLCYPALAADTASGGRAWSLSGLAAPVKVHKASELGAVLTRSLRPIGVPASAAPSAALGTAVLNDAQLAAVIQRAADAASGLEGEVTVSWDAASNALKLETADGRALAVSAEAPALGSVQADKIEHIAASLRALEAFGDVGQTINAAFKPAFDPHEGAADLKLLQTLNADMAKNPRTPDQLRAQGLVADGSQLVERQTDSARKDVLPFRELLLPAAKTGMYAPKKQVPADQVERVVLFMPGIGTDISNAKTVLDVAGTFNKKGSLAYALDVTLNGMGRAMPFSFGSAEGMDAVAHHAVQVLKALHPGKPIYVAGRSQGGLVAVEYAARHDDVAGAIGLSPSHPDATIVKESIPWAENHPTLKIWPKAWEAYKQFTTRFTAAAAASKVPVLLLLDKGDDAYPQPMYYGAWSAWVAEQPVLRTLATFANPATAERHNLWLRNVRENPLYERVIDTMVEFFKKASAINPEVVAPAAKAAAEAPAAAPEVKKVSAADLAALVKPDFSRKLKQITLQTDEVDLAKLPELIAEAKKLGVNEFLIQDPNREQADAMIAQGAFPTVDWVHWKRDSVGFDEYMSEFSGGNRAAMRRRVEAGQGASYHVREFNKENYAAVWKIWKQEIGSRPDALQFVPGVDIWPNDFADKLLAGKTGNPEHGDVKDWNIITAEVDGKVVGGMIIQKRWDRGFVHGRMGAYLPEFVGRNSANVPAGTPVKNFFIEFNLGKKMMEVSREAGLQTSKGTDTGEPGYGTDVMLMHAKFDELFEAVPELHPVMRLVLKPGPNDYVIPTIDMKGEFAKRYFAERAAGKKPFARDVIGSFATKNGWLTTKRDVLEAFYPKRDVALATEHVSSVNEQKNALVGRSVAADVTDGTGKTLAKAGEVLSAAAAAAIENSRVKSLKVLVEAGDARRAHARALLSDKISAETGKPFTAAELDALANADSVKIKVGKPGKEFVNELDLAHETVRNQGDRIAALVGRRAAADVVDGTGAVLMAAGQPMNVKDLGRLVQAGVNTLTLDIPRSERAARAKELLFNRVLAADVLGKNGKPVLRAGQVLGEQAIAKIVELGVSDVKLWHGNPALDKIWGPFLYFTNGEFRPKVPASLKLEARPIPHENGA